MTAPIHSLARSLQLLRTELAEARKRPEHGNAAQLPASAATDAQSPLRRSAIMRLPGKLKALRAAEGEAPQGKVLRAFVEAALLDEFGDEQQLDPSFFELVEKACRAIESDPGNAALLHEALDELSAMLGP